VRRSWQVLVVVIAALALVAVVLSAVAIATSRSNAKTLKSTGNTKTQTLQFTRDFITLAGTDLNPKDSPGDELVIYSNLKGPVTGREAQVCTVLKADKPPRFETTQMQCQETIALAGGQLTGQQLLPVDHKSTREADAAFAITGGTGIYKEARGSGIFSDEGQSLALHVEYLAS
jgi:hypothetical protein